MKEKILIVDDNRELREKLKIFLSGKHEVATAEDGLEALLMLQNGYMPDLIVSEFIMPLVDGKSLVIRIKEKDFLSHIPVIIITSINLSIARADLLKSGASEYLLKPFGFAELELCIDRNLKVIA